MSKLVVAAILVGMAFAMSAAAPPEAETGKFVQYTGTSSISCDDVDGATTWETVVDGNCKQLTSRAVMKVEYDGDACKVTTYAEQDDCILGRYTLEDRVYSIGCTEQAGNVVVVCGPKPFPVGAIVGAVVGVIVLGAVGFFSYKKKQGKGEHGT